MDDADTNERSPEFWAAVVADHAAGMTLPALYKRHGIKKAEFDRNRDRLNLPPRKRAPINRPKLIGRLLWLINRQIAHLEKEMIAGSEKDVALLNQLVGTLGKLIRFEAATTPIDKRRRQTKELAGIREKLVQRIEELKRA